MRHLTTSLDTSLPPVDPFAIFIDDTCHRASSARSLQSSSTSFQQEQATYSTTSVEISLDDNKAENWNLFSLVYRQSLRQICQSHNFVDSVTFYFESYSSKCHFRKFSELSSTPSSLHLEVISTSPPLPVVPPLQLRLLRLQFVN